jgi:hypothetical protein
MQPMQPSMLDTVSPKVTRDPVAAAAVGAAAAATHPCLHVGASSSFASLLLIFLCSAASSALWGLLTFSFGAFTDQAAEFHHFMQHCRRGFLKPKLRQEKHTTRCLCVAGGGGRGRCNER